MKNEFTTENTDYTEEFCDLLNQIAEGLSDEDYSLFSDKVSRMYFDGIEDLSASEILDMLRF